MSAAQSGGERTSLTRIIATVGPATVSVPTLEALIRAGVSVFRLNFSHGDFEAHGRALEAIRAAERSTGLIVATLADLPGPKIRLGLLEGDHRDGIPLPLGGIVRVGHGGSSRAGVEPRLACTYPGIADDAAPGHRILIDDGAVRLLVIERQTSGSGSELVCTTLTGGVARSRKGVNLPDSFVRADPITDRDRACAEFAITAGVDFLGMSFVQDADDLRRLRSYAANCAQRAGRETPPIVAKIERPNAVERIESIVDAADAVMVARGDLGVEMDLAKVPIIQKRVLAVARAAGKPSIVATQMLQSMIESPTPTRAEASDVANAILDGCDAVMLSGETAVGQWPVVAVETMARIAREAESLEAITPRSVEPPARLVRERNHVAALAHGASRAARDLGASAIVAWSQTGTTALLLSRYGFHVPIFAVSDDDAALRRTRLLRGVEPIRFPSAPDSFRNFAIDVETHLHGGGMLRTGDLCLIVSGERFGAGGSQAIMAIREIGADFDIEWSGRPGDDGATES